MPLLRRSPRAALIVAALLLALAAAIAASGRVAVAQPATYTLADSAVSTFHTWQGGDATSAVFDGVPDLKIVWKWQDETWLPYVPHIEAPSRLKTDYSLADGDTLYVISDGPVEITLGDTVPEAADCEFVDGTALVLAATAQVVTPGGAGTAFYIGDDEWVTAAHVVEGGGSIRLRTDTLDHPATVIGRDAAADLALLSASGEGLTALSFGDHDALRVGQSLGLAGYPVTVSGSPSVTSGLLSKVVNAGGVTYLQTDAAANPGSSGGPLFTNCGAVVGVVVAKAVGEEIEGIAWAVALPTVEAVLPRLREGQGTVAPPDEVVLPGNHLVYGAALRSSVITPDEPAQFRFEGAAGDLVRIRVEGIGAMDPVATLLEPNRTEIRTNDDESIANRDSLIIATLPSEGLQVIRVVPYDTLSGGEFIVSVELLQAEAVDDSKVLAVGDRVQARLHAPNDVDTFDFAGEAGQVVRIRADGEIGADTFMEVFGPDGSFLALNDDSGHGLDAELVLALASTGRYRVDVFPAVVGRPAGERHLIGDYVFSVVLLPEPVEAPGETATALARLALTYLDAVQTGDAVRIFGLAGPEKISQTGWKNADDVRRDLSAEQDVVTNGTLGQARAEVEGDRARVYVGVTVPGTNTVLTLRVDATNVNGQWLVDFVERFIPVAEGDSADPSSESPLTIGAFCNWSDRATTAACRAGAAEGLDPEESWYIWAGGVEDWDNLYFSLNGSVPITRADFTLSGLAPGLHTIWIRELRSGVWTDWSAPYTFTVRAPEVLLTILAFCNDGNWSTAAACRADAADGVSATGLVRLWALGVENWDNVRYSVDGAQGVLWDNVSLSGLAPGLHTIWIRELRSGVWTHWSAPYTFTIRADDTQIVVDWLSELYDHVTALFNEHIAIRENTPGVYSYSRAAQLLVDLRLRALTWGDELWARTDSLQGYRVNASCDSARQWIALSAQQMSLVSGWMELIYASWPYADYFDEVEEAGDNYFAARQESLDAIERCGQGQ